MSTEIVAYWLGIGVMVAGGLILVALLLGAAGLAVGVAGAWVFKRLRRTYQLYTIGYWLEQMEKRGTHAFPRPTKENP